LHTAAINRQYITINILLRAGVNVDSLDKQGNTALMKAAYCLEEDDADTYVKIVQALLQAGADASIRNINGKTALDVAKTEVIRTLLLTA
jgi:ankyrin repeat protein